MKHISLLILLFLSVISAQAQTSDSVFTVIQDQSQLKTGILLYGTRNFSQGPAVSGNSISSGLSCQDPMNRRIYQAAPDAIYAFESGTGTLLDTLASGVSIVALEFDIARNGLIALRNGANNLEMIFIDPFTHQINLMRAYPNIQYVQGKSTIDFIRNRIFIKTDLGITIFDTQLGGILDTIADLKNIQAMEYHPGTDKLYGLYWDGNNEVLTVLDPNTKSYTDIGTLTGVTSTTAVHTIDITHLRMLFMSNLGLTIINLTNAAIVDAFLPSTISGVDDFVTLEYLNSFIINSVKDIESSDFKVYPNPSTGQIQLDGIPQGTHFSVYTLQGKRLKSFDGKDAEYDVTDLPAGHYIIRTEGGQTARFILTR